jgi:hypothetical protein
MNKQLLQTVEAIKSTYKDLKYDIQEMQDESAKLLTEGNGGGISRNSKGLIAVGTRDLIKQVKKLRHPDADIQDIQTIE